MKHIFRSITAISAVLLVLMTTSPAFANHNWSICFDVQIAVNGVFYKEISLAPPPLGNDTYTDSDSNYTTGALITVYNPKGTSTVSVGCGVTLNFTDGRCNQEPYQSVAVYPDNKGGYNFYALYNGVGYFAMHVTEQNLDDNANTGVTHKIAEAKGVQLFRLAGGGLQVNRMGADNKMYSYTIGSCGAMED